MKNRVTTRINYFGNRKGDVTIDWIPQMKETRNAYTIFARKSLAGIKKAKETYEDAFDFKLREERMRHDLVS
jgi:hypothetical protein